jgi:hypothetical protein
MEVIDERPSCYLIKKCYSRSVGQMRPAFAGDAKRSPVTVIGDDLGSVSEENNIELNMARTSQRIGGASCAQSQKWL